MSFSARIFGRKWSCRGFMSARGAMVITALGLSLAQVVPVDARKHAKQLSPPLDLLSGGVPGARKPTQKGPGPRPAETPAPAKKPPAGDKPSADSPVEQVAPPAPRASERQAPEHQASACRLALTEEIAIAPSIPDIHGPHGCGGEDLVRLEAIVLRDKRKVVVKPAAILRCGMASALADWVRSDMAPLALSLGSVVSELDNYDSYECRGRNRVAGAILSEHGRANALDVRALKLANGRSIGLTDRAVSRDLRERVRHSACSRFTTVLGPGSDGYHEEHIHFDLVQRRSGYRICRWNVLDRTPSSQAAAESQSRDNAAPGAAKPDTAQGDSPGESLPMRKPSTKKRR